MKEITIRLEQDITKLSIGALEKAAQRALRKKVGEIKREAAIIERIKSIHRDASRVLGVPIRNLNHLVEILLPHTTPRFRTKIGYVSSEEPSPTPKVEKTTEKRTRRSNHVKKVDLTDEELELISQATTMREINPLPVGSKNAGKTVPWPTWCGIKGLNLRTGHLK